MKIVQLEYFCMVSHYHSITQAAQKLYVTQPAISNAIKELEKEFSVSLFVRSKNHLTLTTEGELFYQKASELLASIKSGQADSAYPYRHPAAVKHDFFSGSRPEI